MSVYMGYLCAVAYVCGQIVWFDCAVCQVSEGYQKAGSCSMFRTPKLASSTSISTHKVLGSQRDLFTIASDQSVSEKSERYLSGKRGEQREREEWFRATRERD